MTSLVGMTSLVMVMRSSECTTYLDNYDRLLSDYLQYSAHKVIRTWSNTGGKRHAREDMYEGEDRQGKRHLRKEKGKGSNTQGK